MKRSVFGLLLCLMTGLAAAKGGKTDAYDVTLGSLLTEMVDRTGYTRFPDPMYRQAQVSSYDRRTVDPSQPGWWANNDGGGYERMDTIAARQEKVLCDLKGPGVVSRIWLTTNDKRGTLRIYLDNAAEPQIVIPAYDMRQFPLHVPEGLSLIHTHYDQKPESTGGNTFYLPIPYAQKCLITLEEPAPDFNPARYYHIGYRSYDARTRVRTFSLSEAKELEALITQTSQQLLHPVMSQSSQLHTVLAQLSAGEDVMLQLRGHRKGSQITELSIQADDMDKVRIEAYFDGVKTIDVPLSHFAGAGMGAPEVRSWWLQCQEGKAVCRFPMPYRRHAQIRLVNQSANTINVQMEAEVASYRWDGRSLYFHVTERSERDIPLSPNYDSNDNLDWSFADFEGRGVYMGDLLSLDNHAQDWYGEGDEKIYVDNERFPSFMGTGTEDYYNCSWAPVVPFHTPFGGAPRADEPTSHGINAFMRTRNLDAIPFRRRLKFDLEMLSWHPGTVDYYATAYWYGDLGVRIL